MDRAINFEEEGWKIDFRANFFLLCFGCKSFVLTFPHSFWNSRNFGRAINLVHCEQQLLGKLFFLDFV